MIGLIFATIGGVLIWQRIEAGAASNAPDRAKALFAEAGLTFSFAKAEIGGAPARVNIRFAEPSLEPSAGGWRWRSSRLDVDRLVYRMRTAALGLNGPHELTTPSGVLRFDQSLLARARFEDDALRGLSARLTNLNATWTPTGDEAISTPAKVLEVQLCAPLNMPDGCGEAAPAYDADKGWPLLSLLRVGAMKIGNGVRLSAAFKGVAYLAAPIRVDAPPPALREIAITDGKIALLPPPKDAAAEKAERLSDKVDAAVISFTGAIRLSADGYRARFAFETTNAARAIDALAQAGVLSPKNAAELRKAATETDTTLKGALVISSSDWRIEDLAAQPIVLDPPQ